MAAQCISAHLTSPHLTGESLHRAGRRQCWCERRRQVLGAASADAGKNYLRVWNVIFAEHAEHGAAVDGARSLNAAVFSRRRAHRRASPWMRDFQDQSSRSPCTCRTRTPNRRMLSRISSALFTHLNAEAGNEPQRLTVRRWLTSLDMFAAPLGRVAVCILDAGRAHGSEGRSQQNVEIRVVGGRAYTPANQRQG